MRTATFLAATLLAGTFLSAASTSAAAQQDEMQQQLEAIQQRLLQIERMLAAGQASGFQGFNEAAMQDMQKRDLESTGGGMPQVDEDADQDGLTNAEEGMLGTDAANADTDGDALLDGWEVHGVNGIDLHKLGANPLRKDIFVEMDYMVRGSASNGLGPNTDVLDRIRQVFADAPVLNPNGSRGISIHLELGNEVPYDDDLNPAPDEFAAIKRTEFDSRRLPVFHYMIWADRYNGGTSSGNAFAIPNSDFIVTLGAWNSGKGGDDDEKVGTFIHELGHNLGLKHGGSDHVGYKPNHLSVMNYAFQTAGILVGSDRKFDFQRFALSSLDETSLIDSLGLGGSSNLRGYHTRIRQHGLFDIPADGPIDWNNNGVIDRRPVMVDLNRDLLFNVLRATPDEWNSIIYDGGAIGTKRNLGLMQQRMDQTRKLLPEVELTEEMDKQQGN